MSNLSPDELLAIHKQYADTFAALAQSGLVAAFGRLSDSKLFKYNPAKISITTPNFGTPNRTINLPQSIGAPTIDNLGFLVDPIDIPAADYGNAPADLYSVAPKYDAPTKPEIIPFLSAEVPDVNTDVKPPHEPSFLSMPALKLPYPTVNIPDAPVITRPIFEGRRPNDIFIPDAETMLAAYRNEQTSHRNLLPGFVTGNVDGFISKYVPEYTVLRSRINTAITNYTDATTGGGIGIPEQIELAITARATDKNAQEFIRALETSSDTLSKKGWSMPPGALLSTIRQARMAMGDATVRGNIDLATKNLEMEQQNFQFMLKLGEALEEKILETISQWMTLTLRMDELSIMSAKEIISAYLGIYNIQVLVYKALWDGYLADAEVFKAKIAAMDADVRLYEAQIKAEIAKTEVNKSYVAVLQAIADMNRAMAETYKAQIEAALAPLEVSKVQLAVYEAKLRGFASQVQVYEAQWNGYKAEVEGEIGRMRGYEAEVNGYTAKVGGYKARVEAYGAMVNAVGEANKSVFGRNDATVKVYAAKAETAIKIYEGLLAGYTAESNVVIKQADIEVEYWRTSANLIMQEYTTTLQQTFEFAREQMNLFRGQMEAAISAANGLSQASAVAGNLAGGAMAGLTSFAGKLVSSDG